MRIVSRPLETFRPHLEALAARHGVEIVTVDDTALLHRELANADALWLWPAYYDAALVDVLERHAKRLCWLQLLTMGYDPVEQYGAPRGVTITNAGDAYAPTVAEHAVAMLLAALRQLPASMRNAAGAKWDPSLAARIGTLFGATVAVVGFGNIGREIAARLRGFGAQVIAVTRSGRADLLADEAVSAKELAGVLSRSDAVVLAVPLTPATRHLIDATALAEMRPHAVLVNISRGGVVDQAALTVALAAGSIGAAALDVTDPEPLPADDPLWTLPNAIITPHVAGYGGSVPGRRVLELIERNLGNFQAGRQLEAPVPLLPRIVQAE